MTIKLHDTRMGKKVAFEPIEDDKVTMYLCGPTVYNYAHIGNARPAVVFDLLARVLRRRYELRFARNFTDVDDKINAASLETGKPIGEITEKFMRIYNEDMAALGVLPPDVEPRATEHIAEMITMISALIEKGYAYESEGHVLFDDVYIPKVYREVTSSRVLTAEFVEGIKISDIDGLKSAGLDRTVITARGADLVLKQVFEHGFFHADPHPGNIFALPNNVICLIDFGMVGVVDRQTRNDFVDLLDSIVHQNEIAASEVLLKLTYWDQEPDRRLLEREVADFMGRHLYKPLKEIELGKLLQQLLEVAGDFQLRIPPDLFLMMKALGTVEGVGRMLDPDFDMIARATPFIAKVKLERYTTERIVEDVFDLSARLMRFLRQFPKELLDITQMIRRQKLSVRIEHRGLETMLITHDRISNRISFSILIAALIIGSALIVISETPPLIYGISLIGILLFFAAAMMGIWLLVAILRKGKL